MTPLENEIVTAIAAEGPISLESFMTLALMHPEYGYYRTRMPIGRKGDFTTAPEIHQMFGELVGLWAAEVWRMMDEPSPLRLIELGPGRGTLMADILRTARVMPAFRAAVDIHLIEQSEVLIDCQRATLAPFGDTVTWHASMEDLPRGPAIIIANEFFDALPVRHYIRTREGWNERLVGLDGDRKLTFGLAPAPEAALDALAPMGSVLEIGLIAQRSMSALAAHVAREGGALLVIDYGYLDKRTGETLQAVKSHAFVDPLTRPGETDLTAHVDFAALARAALAAGAEVHGPVAQGVWLGRLGIFERAAALKRKATPEQAAAVDLALARLAQPGPAAGRAASMAELFKVLCVSAPGLVPPGFEPALDHDAFRSIRPKRM
jgi:NADH dehydrogenase [ubiquinone] 1 alpha subcomplex assembly factor 7